MIDRNFKYDYDEIDQIMENSFSNNNQSRIDSSIRSRTTEPAPFNLNYNIEEANTNGAAAAAAAILMNANDFANSENNKEF